MPKLDKALRTSLPLPGQKYSGYPTMGMSVQATPVNLLDYLYKPGQPGGQVAYGGLAATDSLILNGALAGGDILLNANGGNVGVGQPNPASKFHVWRSEVITADSIGASVFNLDTSSTADVIKMGLQIEVSGENSAGVNVGLSVAVAGGLYNTAATFIGGNVGIDTDYPIWPLDVVGDINTNSGFRIGSAGPNGYFLIGDGSHYTGRMIQPDDLPFLHPHLLASSVGLSEWHTVEATGERQVLITSGPAGANFRALEREDLPTAERNLWTRDDDTDTLAPYTAGDNVQVDGILYLTDANSYIENDGVSLNLVSEYGLVSLGPATVLGSYTYVWPTSGIGADKIFLIDADGNVTFTDLSAVTTEAHAIDGALHTASGLTAGHILTALSATTFGFAALTPDHAAVTLSAALGTNLLSLSTQELGLDTQTAGYAFMGPASGAAAAPAFRALLDTDLGTGRSSGYYLQTDGAGVMTWVAPGAGHDALTLADAATQAILGLSTQALSFDVQVAKTFLAGPTSGADAQPAFRTIAAADLPAHTHTELWTRTSTNLAPTTAGDTASAASLTSTGGYVYLVDTASYLLRASTAIALVTDKTYVAFSPESADEIYIQQGKMWPQTTNVTALGDSTHRYSNVYGVLGNLSGQLTLSVATGTAPMAVTSTTKVSNLNADLLDDLSAAVVAGALSTIAARDGAGTLDAIGYKVSGAAPSGYALMGDGSKGVYRALTLGDLPSGINADTVDTFHAQTATAANTCAVRDSNQYLNCAGYLINGAAASGYVLKGDGTKGTFGTISDDMLGTGRAAGRYLRTGGAGPMTWVDPATDHTHAHDHVPVTLDLVSGTVFSLTGTGTQTLVLNSQTANRIFAAPTGASGTPGFRPMALLDLGSLYSQLATAYTLAQRTSDGSLAVTNAFASGEVQATNVQSVNGYSLLGGATGKSGTTSIVTQLQYSGATLQKKTRSIEFMYGIITVFGSESDWVNV